MLIPKTDECPNCPIHLQRQDTQPGIKATYQRRFDITTELTIVCQYHCQHKSSINLGKQYHCTQDTIQNILRRYGKPPRAFRQAQQTRRGSTPLTFPLTAEIPNLQTNPENQPYLRHLIAILLLTDGSAGYRQSGHPFITFTNKAHILHALFVDLIHHAYNQPPSAYYKPYWSQAKQRGSKAYYTTYFRRHDTHTILQDLLTLTPTFRTRPKRGQSWEEYLQEETHPSIQFLLEKDLPKPIRVFATRLAMCTEGTITPMFRKDSSKPFPHLVFSCQHPRLLNQWQRFFNSMELELSHSNGRLDSGQIITAMKFLKIGGFFPGMFVQIGSYYEGLTKQQILKGIFLAREQTKIDPQLKLKEKHKIIREFASQISDEQGS